MNDFQVRQTCEGYSRCSNTCSDIEVGQVYSQVVFAYNIIIKFCFIALVIFVMQNIIN